MVDLKPGNVYIHKSDGRKMVFIRRAKSLSLIATCLFRYPEFSCKYVEGWFYPFEVREPQEDWK